MLVANKVDSNDAGHQPTNSSNQLLLEQTNIYGILFRRNCLYSRQRYRKPIPSGHKFHCRSETVWSSCILLDLKN